MPENSLNKTTERRLQSFAKRTRTFAGIRGTLTGLALLLIALAVIATLDWLVIMPNPVRWTLTGVSYFVAMVGMWRFGLREFLRTRSDVETAKSMESAAPELREEVLSAVELADYDPDTVRDSAEFRELVQRSVAQQVAEVEPTKLLPWRSLRRFAVAAASGLALVALLAVFVGVGFASRLIMRAAVPGAKIARIAGVEIEILEPSPASIITRAGDPVKLRFRVSKPEVRVAQLSLRADGHENKLRLRAAEKGVFEATVRPERATIEYSLEAGDAVTSVHEIEPHTPPVILGFEKRYEFPDYLHRDPLELKERDGHLKAIEGTTVRLRIVTDQPSAGHIELAFGDEATTIPLRPAGDCLAANIPVSDSGRYKILLTGKRSRLPAEFAPTYQINAHPDKAPRIRLVSPAAEQVVQPDAVVSVQASAEDDFGIVRVEQWMSRNGSNDWEKFPLAMEAEVARKTAIAFRWDLLKHHVEAGDLITTKLVVFDGRGELAESREVDLTVNFRDLDPDRLDGLRARERAFGILEELNENSSAKLAAFRASTQKGADTAKLYEMDQEAWSALGRLKFPLQSMPSGRDTYDLTLAARSASIGRHLGVRQAIRRVSFARTLKTKTRAQRTMLPRPCGVIAPAATWCVR